MFYSNEFSFGYALAHPFCPRIITKPDILPQISQLVETFPIFEHLEDLIDSLPLTLPLQNRVIYFLFF